MFNILKYQHDAVTDAIEIRVSFQLKPTSEIKLDGGHFNKKSQGDAWLHNLKRDYFTIKVENYIQHKKYIIEAGPGHKSLSAKKVSLDILNRFLFWAVSGKGLGEICKWALESQKHFETILPSQNNNSFESSEAALSEIMNFARQHSNNHLLKKAS